MLSLLCSAATTEAPDMDEGAGVPNLRDKKVARLHAYKQLALSDLLMIAGAFVTANALVSMHAPEWRPFAEGEDFASEMYTAGDLGHAAAVKPFIASIGIGLKEMAEPMKQIILKRCQSDKGHYQIYGAQAG